MSLIYVEARVQLSDVLSEVGIKDIAEEIEAWDDKGKAQLLAALSPERGGPDDATMIERLRRAADDGDILEVRRLIDLCWPLHHDAPAVIAKRYADWKAGKYQP